MATGRRTAVGPVGGRAVGRVGGLVVALGIGGAIALGATGTAWATGDETASAGTGHASSQHSSTAPGRKAQRRHHDSRKKADSTTSRTIESTEAGDGDGPSPAAESARRKPLKHSPRDEKPAETVTRTVRNVADTVVAPRRQAGDPPEAPAANPALWTLFAASRRETDRGGSVAAPTLPATSGKTFRPATDAATSQAGPDWEKDYTGTPSVVADVVTAGLKALQVALKPFGGLLTFTSLRIPVFTDGLPPIGLMGGLKVHRTEYEGMPVWSLEPRKEATDKVVVAIHGGAYVGQVSVFHWWTYAGMARDTGATFLVPIYTLAPKGTAATEVPRMADFIATTIDDHGADNVSVLGDSAGGGLALAAIQEMVRRRETTPGSLVLLAPWLDVSMSDPRSAEIDDPLLDIPNLTKDGVKWAGGLSTTDPLVSPLFGSLDGLPPTYVFSSSRDLLTVDTLRLRDRVVAEGIPNVTFTLRKGLIHDFATFPFLPDAHWVRPEIYRDLLGSATSEAVA
ncbi:esterase/lipase [Mycolicibacterium chubuense NBB4]|uniref:Esterase/lipase n=1 Tax=Mycolicibacterium chubuense (strain NBB4) TaxID=710421 RepID=I4BGL8_MYCCN|nr:alpha/beta hydrolase [Mycolicibacterium chubuense]AFM16425.1 esterase/lipase [Mycolicibacterium chubuense NBB4]